MTETQDTIQPSQDEVFYTDVPKRQRFGRIWLLIFQVSTIVGILALSALLYNIINGSMGYVAFETKINPNEIADGIPLTSLTKIELVEILQNNLTANRYRTLNNENPIESRTQDELIELIGTEVLKIRVIDTWPLITSLFNKRFIEQEVIKNYPQAYLQFRNWINLDFIKTTQSSNALLAGVRVAILGSLWIIFITIGVAFPIGVGAAIYLEEYANTERFINRLIQTNINNLAAVPSIIYGILGLTIFVRALEPLTSGSLFGLVDNSTTANGRTILAGGLTLAILVLPLIIINAQEAIRSVPKSLRQASFGIGASKWQTVSSHVLPNAIPGILTGTILAISRAFGETAPLIVVGVSTYITVNPTSVFSKFTTLPAQIYQWTARPQVEWRNLAAAAILVLLFLLLVLNATAIILRNRYTRKYN